MDLWNAVEKDKVVQAARRSAAARNRTRLEPGQPPLKKVCTLHMFGTFHAAFASHHATYTLHWLSIIAPLHVMNYGPGAALTPGSPVLKKM